jgi:hypothetical protein
MTTSQTLVNRQLSNDGTATRVQGWNLDLNTARTLLNFSLDKECLANSTKLTL